MKKKFLLHTCCAPCGVAIIDELKDKFFLTVFFYNPNIHPKAEYDKRKKEVVKICKEWGIKMVDMDEIGNNVLARPNFVPSAAADGTTLGEPASFSCKSGQQGRANHERDRWSLAIRGFEKESEGGKRCPRCFWLRLSVAAEYGAKHGFKMFGTTLTMGRNKKAEVINPIGQAVGHLYGIEFYPVDWKKEGRQEKGKRMTEERGIYRQNYCGCRYSLNNNQ